MFFSEFSAISAVASFFLTVYKNFLKQDIEPMINIKSPREVELISKSCRIVAESLQYIERFVEQGITLKELERLLAEFIVKKDAIPAFKGYRGYPAAVCISLNDEVVHGIPDERVLKEGDIVSIDIGVKKDGYFGDGAKTYGVGKISAEAKKLMKVTESALYKGINKACDGNRLYDISSTIQQSVESAGFSVVRELTGHGIGQKLHEEPIIPNFGMPGVGPRLKSGMVLAIEPMVNAGKYDVVTLSNGWTVKTKDGSISAHFEHTLVVGKDGAEILTVC